LRWSSAASDVYKRQINYFVKNSRIEEAEVISGQKFLDFLIEDKTFFVKEMIRVETDNLLSLIHI
ncbi:hypothetical protein KQJ30_32660, partial [Enterococcus sp. S157_ASV_20]|nr:hypothetical protein [Enterococcus sp. S157_ASV_20]